MAYWNREDEMAAKNLRIEIVYKGGEDFEMHTNGQPIPNNKLIFNPNFQCIIFFSMIFSSQRGLLPNLIIFETFEAKRSRWNDKETTAGKMGSFVSLR